MEKHTAQMKIWAENNLPSGCFNNSFYIQLHQLPDPNFSIVQFMSFFLLLEKFLQEVFVRTVPSGILASRCPS